MKLKAIFFGLLLTPLLAFADQPNLHGFTYHKEPINPACLALVNSDIDDLPYIQQIDLNGCQNPGVATMKVHLNDRGEFFIYKNNKDKSRGTFAYKVIGKAPNNIFVVQTFNGMPDGKVFDNLMLIRLFRQHEYIYKQTGEPYLRDHFAIKVVAYVHGGYKCAGGVKSAVLSGFQLHVTTYMDHQEPNDCKLHRSYTIDLSKIKN